MSPSTPSTTRKICNRLLVLCAAMTMGLVGCYPQFPDPVGSVQFERDGTDEDGSASMEATKPPNAAPSLGVADASVLLFGTTQLPGVAKDSSLQVAESSVGELNEDLTNSASSETSEDEEGNAAREVEDEEEAESECKEADRFGNLSVEIDGPTAVFTEDSIDKDVKIVIYNDSASNADKVQVSIHLSKDEIIDDDDLILSEPEHLVAGPGSFSDLQVDPGQLQPLAGIDSGDYHVIVRIDEQDSNSPCMGADNVASFALQVI
jgi:hypothetical protein